MSELFELDRAAMRLTFTKEQCVQLTERAIQGIVEGGMVIDLIPGEEVGEDMISMFSQVQALVGDKSHNKEVASIVLNALQKALDT